MSKQTNTPLWAWAEENQPCFWIHYELSQIMKALRMPALYMRLWKSAPLTAELLAGRLPLKGRRK